MTPQDPIVLVVAEGDSQGAINHARGHLFEDFIAQLLHLYGYEEPRFANLGTTANGVELDVRAKHTLTSQPALAECKAYSSPVSADMLGNFHSKLITARYDDPHTHGFFVALPRLTSPAQETAERIANHDTGFTVLTAVEVHSALLGRQMIVPCPMTGLLTSDTAVIVSKHGVYSACVELDPSQRTPSRVLVWAKSGNVPEPVIRALSKTSYAEGVSVSDARHPVPVVASAGTESSTVVVTVAGSNSDFEYQLPASPKYFVGRKETISALRDVLAADGGSVVLNAQSGWGKSSVALRLESLTKEQKGFAVVVDTRTANHRRFVTDALRMAADRASAAGVLKLPSDASWASLHSSLRTFRDSVWTAGKLVIFFDQFENAFRNEGLTEEFRDLVLGSQDISKLLIGFAWKTDLVGWTENHPYRLRDEIRASAKVLTLGPLGATEVDTLLRRLEKEIGEPLARDLRTRLREYSQGLPWLLKKLAGHLLREIKAGVTQEKLTSEGLNIQNLFDADLAELGPVEQEALRHVARFAPIAVSEVMEKVSAPIVESLVNRRLIVQVGEKLDTYWDIFRDYLNSGRVPVEDSYILRQSPVSVARLLSAVLADDGDGNVKDIASRLNTSENAIFNLSRELRLLGATTFESYRVKLSPEIMAATDKEAELRKRVGASLRRHRAFSAFTGLAERLGDVSIAMFAKDLPSAFPAVEVTPSTWTAYARVYLSWFEYAGLAVQLGQGWGAAPEGTVGSGELIGGSLKRRMRAGAGFPHDSPGPALKLLVDLHSGAPVPTAKPGRRALSLLRMLGAVEVNAAGDCSVMDGLVAGDKVVASELRKLIEEVPGSRLGWRQSKRTPV